MPPNDPFKRAAGAFGKGGMARLAREARQMERQASAAAAQMERLAKAADDPAVRQAVINTINLTKETEKLNSATRTRMDLEARRQAVASGAYARDLAAMRQIAREQERVFELERKAQFQSRFGRFGGSLAYAADHFSRSRAGQMILGAAAVGGATVGAMASRGFGGTVEGNRMQLELTMISRELAGAFKPAIEAATKALQHLRKFLERLGPRGQDAVMYGGLALGAYGTYRALGAVGGMLGIGGAAAGAAGAGGIGAAGVGAGAAAATAGGRGLLGFAKTAAKRAGLAGGALMGLEELTNPDGFYEMERRRGTSRLGSGFAAVGHTFMDAVSFGRHSRRLRERGELGAGEVGPDEGRRKVTIADSGFEAPGSAFERITNKLALVEAADEDGAGGWIKAIHDIIAGAFKDAAAGRKPPLLKGRP